MGCVLWLIIPMVVMVSGAPHRSHNNTVLEHLRPTYHFLSPQGGWMNDPNGPMYYRGKYHLFWQKGGEQEAVWGDIHWGHAYSADLVNWNMLPVALSPGPDEYDSGGCWSGSATFTPRSSLGSVGLLYTGVSQNLSTPDFPWNEVQALAVPSDPRDPLLQNWTKWKGNPVLPGPPISDTTGFRDPSTAWQVEEDGSFFLAVGSGVAGVGGAVLLYESNSNELTEWTYKGILSEGNVSATGVVDWECPDFYPLADITPDGDERVPNSTWVLKISADKHYFDEWSLGTYYADEGYFKAFPGQAGRVDYGNYYASKSFWDQDKQRRVLWGWVPEDDSTKRQVARGWAGIQAIPREIHGELKYNSLRFLPVPEMKSLRQETTIFDIEEKGDGTNEFQVPFWQSAQYEIELIVDPMKTKAKLFGLYVLANSDRSFQQYTSIVIAPTNGTITVNRTKSTIEPTANKEPQQGPIREENAYFLHVFVDHSVVEVFADNYHTVITSRVYPVLGTVEGGGTVSVWWDGEEFAARIRLHKLSNAVIE